jgi:hypothetical protein
MLLKYVCSIQCHPVLGSVMVVPAKRDESHVFFWSTACPFTWARSTACGPRATASQRSTT